MGGSRQRSCALYASGASSRHLVAWSRALKQMVLAKLEIGSHLCLDWLSGHRIQNSRSLSLFTKGLSYLGFRP